MATCLLKPPVRSTPASSAPYHSILAIPASNLKLQRYGAPAIAIIDPRIFTMQAWTPLRHNSCSSAEAVRSIVGLVAAGFRFVGAPGLTPRPR